MFLLFSIIQLVLFVCVEANTFPQKPTVDVSLSSSSQSPGIQLGEECRPRPVIRDLGRANEAIHPRNVRLYQCSGFDGFPTTKNEMCVPTTRREVRVVFYDVDMEEKVVRSFYNDTECGMKCVCTLNDHVCDDSPLDVVVNCPDQLTWDSDICSCVNDLTGGLPPPTTKPNPSTGVSVGILVGSLIGEFLVIILVVIGVLKYFNCHKTDRKGGDNLLTR